MRSDAFDPQRLDLPRFAESGAVADGDWPAVRLARLTEDAPPAGDGQVHWAARGEWRQAAGAGRQTWLHLQARTEVRLTCQRCLQAMDVLLEAEARYRFVADEALAEAQDEEAEEDVLALPPRGRLDLIALVEDELILALPLVPRHEDCPMPLPVPADVVPDALPAEHPFAALGALKARKG